MDRSHRYTRITLATLLSLGLLLFVAVGTAFAHAKVIDSNPKMGSTIAQAPTIITVTTAENMKPGAQFSNLFVYGPSGALVSQGDGKIPLNNPKQMSITITPEKNPGIYVVRWITVSADDGDPDQGAFVFTVNPAPATTVAPKPAPQTATPAVSPTTSTTTLWAAVAVGVVALLVGFGAGLGIGRRRATSTPVATTTQAAAEKEETTTKS